MFYNSNFRILSLQCIITNNCPLFGAVFLSRIGIASPENDLAGSSWHIENGLIDAKPLHLLKKYNSEIGKPRKFKVNKPF